ncbi:sugar transferase [Silicimonas sp. MF1-12-2]|uniref:sugar transferase n=1 Tax=Silicimonas sp. MF1-12-2 TaxID=3384793 RepID=UPI0039B6005F
MTDQRLIVEAVTNSVFVGKQYRSQYVRWGKRTFDIFFVIITLPFVLPVTLLLWALARMAGESGFFAQDRVGKDGRVFRCWKIRSMIPNSQEVLDRLLEQDQDLREEWARDQKLENDPRITRLGRILRKSSLDELPQFWNVFKGEMSLVGPRPVLPEELARYKGFSGFYTSVRPGITGLWQVSGRNGISYDERVRIDAHYTRTVSLAQDLRIILLTVLEVFRLQGR